jgi:DNA repair protein RadD
MAITYVDKSETARKILGTQSPSILRPNQVDLIDNIRAEIRNEGRRIVAQACTGFGKTLCAATMARGVLDRGKRVLFTVPAISLIDQTIEKFRAEGINDIGVIQANHPLTNPMMRVQIASVQTLMNREMPVTDLIVIDEVHRFFTAYAEWARSPRWEEVPFIGLSATPWTKGLGQHFDKLIIGATTRQLIDRGYLSPFKVFAPASPDLSEVRVMAGDYHEGDLGEVMNRNGLVADVVETWQRLGQGRPTLCFAVDRAHARNLQMQFIAAGVKAEYIDAFTPASERNEIGRRFNSGEVEIVCNVGCLTTGIDWDVRAIILARPTKSEMLFVQMIGRGLRTAEGKNHCLILDHSDNHARLGFVTDIHHEELDDGKQRPKAASKPREALPQKCPRCSFLKPLRVITCPVCAFTPKPVCEIVTTEGDLVELARAGAPPEADRRIFYAELRQIAADRGTRPGWAAHKFREKFGSFPPWDWNDAPTATPTATTLRWVKSRQIAYAKSRAS